MTGATPPASLLARARRMGPLRYSELPPRGPWLEEPELASWEAETIDRWWHTLGRPDPFAVVEVGAGDGRRARQVLEWGPECLAALRLVLIEPSMAAAHAQILPIEEPAFLFPAGSPDPSEPEPEPLPATGVGPLVTSLPELPVLDGPAVVLAVGWLSRLPADHFEWRDNRWWEVRLAASGDQLEEMLVPWEERVPLASGVEGSRLVRPVEAIRWLVAALRTAPAGVLAVVDRWSPTGDPASGLALPLDQLAAVRPPMDPAPVPVAAGLGVVSWRLG